MSGAEGRLLGLVRAEPASTRGVRAGTLGWGGGQRGGLGPILSGGEEEGMAENEGMLRGLLAVERGATVWEAGEDEQKDRKIERKEG